MIAVTAREKRVTSSCFGGRVEVHVSGELADVLAERALAHLLEADIRLSRFRSGSDLSVLNRDPRPEVPVTSMVASLAAAVGEAGRMSGGLVDATILPALERAGYSESMEPRKGAMPRLADGAPRRPALPGTGWKRISVTPGPEPSVTRPPGLTVDSGGLAKGMAADTAARCLRDAPAFCVDCAGDLVIGGTAKVARQVEIAHPLREEAAHVFEVVDGAVATSGTTRRSWTGPGGARRHHLIDPGRGIPAETGIVQASALAPSGLEAEIRAKASLLSGPRAAAGHLPHGGIVVLEDGEVVEVPPAGGTP